MSIGQKAVPGLLLFLFGVTSLSAQEFWDEPFEKWNSKSVSRMISDSPWSQNQIFNTPMVDKDSGLRGEKEILSKFTVRFFSALPVRQAYVRMMQLINKYDEMAPAQRTEFDSRFKKALTLDVSDRVIVSLDFSSNNPDSIRDVKQFFTTARTETIKQYVYLIGERTGRVSLKEYFPPSSDGTGAKFVFPRTHNGQPVIAAGDKEARFEFEVPLADNGGLTFRYRLSVNFKVEKMIYKGELSY